MPLPRIACDYAATTPVAPEVLEAMAPYWQDVYHNASSLYQGGKKASQALQTSRETVAHLLGLPAEAQVFWTASATEANNWALKGLAWGLKSKGNHIITSSTEHPSVLEPLTWLETQGFQVTRLRPDNEGFISPTQLASALSPKTILVSLMHGNNEVGTLQDIASLTAITQAQGVLFHCDAVQTLGKLPVHWQSLGVDALSGSGHKIYGPKGIGILALGERAQVQIVPLLHGGGQEQGFRASTQNVAGAVGFSRALQLATQLQATDSPRMSQLAQRLYQGILKLAPHVVLNGPKDWSRRLPGNLNLSFPPASGEALVLRFDLAGVAVSSGSACHQGEAVLGSSVLKALGASEAVAKSSIRFSLGRHTTPQEVDALLERLPSVLSRAGYTG